MLVKENGHVTEKQMDFDNISYYGYMMFPIFTVEILDEYNISVTCNKFYYFLFRHIFFHFWNGIVTIKCEVTK